MLEVEGLDLLVAAEFPGKRISQPAARFRRLHRLLTESSNFLYRDCLTPSGLPMDLIARMEILDCCRKSGEVERGLRAALGLYEEIVGRAWDLNQGQFLAYSSLIDEAIRDDFLPRMKDVSRSGEEEHGKIVDRLRRAREQKTLIRQEAEALSQVQFSMPANVLISDHSGRTLWGKKNPSLFVPSVTAYFDDNFPPWKIEIFRAETSRFNLSGLAKSFYFGTILTMVVVLVFGAALVARTLARERELLQVKSDFVSSVSHEFKTPLTSIKALLERLKEGKVQDPEKMKQYFSVLSQDADRLTRLVGNVLNFSRSQRAGRNFILKRRIWKSLSRGRWIPLKKRKRPGVSISGPKSNPAFRRSGSTAWI